MGSYGYRAERVLSNNMRIQLLRDTSDNMAIPMLRDVSDNLR